MGWVQLPRGGRPGGGQQERQGLGEQSPSRGRIPTPDSIQHTPPSSKPAAAGEPEVHLDRAEGVTLGAGLTANPTALASHGLGSHPAVCEWGRPQETPGRGRRRLAPAVCTEPGRSRLLLQFPRIAKWSRSTGSGGQDGGSSARSPELPAGNLGCSSHVSESWLLLQ